MATKISTFLQTIGQGVKPNMFVVDIVWPTSSLNGTSVGSTDKDLVNLLCKSAALPASNLGSIEVPFRGRTVKIAGDRTFDNWTATFFNDKDMLTRAYFEKWSEAMNTHDGNYAPLFTPSDADGYTCDVKVKQLEKNADTAGGQVIREYTLKHAFPTNISQIDLAYDSNDQIEEFSVEFQYSYWLVNSATGGNLNGGSKGSKSENITITD
jgi:hypothetical protein